MNVEQNYDALEGKGKVEPRPIRRDDVLKHRCGDHYLVFATKDFLILGHLGGGCHYGDGASVDDVHCLTREEASSLCGGNPDCFRLIGRAKDVLTVQDPGA